MNHCRTNVKYLSNIRLLIPVMLDKGCFQKFVYVFAACEQTVLTDS